MPSPIKSFLKSLQTIKGKKQTTQTAVPAYFDLERYKHDPVLFAEEVLGVQLTEDQKQILRCFPGRVKVNSAHSVGKAQPLDTKVLTPWGETFFGNLEVGDGVFGADGKPTKVVAIHPQGKIKQYRVTFDDRSSTLVSGEHLWKVRSRQGRRCGSGWGRRDADGWEILTTEQIAARGIRRTNGKATTRNWEIPRQAPVQFNSRHVVVDPYTMGVWLGDGCSTSAVITTADDEIVTELRRGNAGAARGAGKKGSKCFSVHVKGLKDKLKFMGILKGECNTKRIPHSYMINSVEVRLAVLQGLMDTDGTVSTTGNITFCSTSKGLIDDIVWLVRSLGGKARILPTPKRPHYRTPSGEKKYGQLAYNVLICLPEFPVFRLSRKLARVRLPSRTSVCERMIESIEPEGEAEMQCITVSNSDGLYLTNDFIVTHNSYVAAVLAIFWYFTRDPGVVIITAPTRDHVETVLWAEIRMLLAKAKIPHVGKLAPKAAFLFHHDDHWIRGYTSRSGEAFQGRHRSSMLFLMDESEDVDAIYWTTTETMYQPGSDHGWFAIGNPITTSSQSYLEDLAEGSDGKPKWKLFTLSALEHPNIRNQLNGLPPVIPNAVTIPMVNQWVKDWTDPVSEEDRLPTDIEWPPRMVCPKCKASNGTDRAIPPTGSVASGFSGLLGEESTRPPSCNVCQGLGFIGGGKYVRPGPQFKARVLGIRPTEGVDTVWSELAWLRAIQPKYTYQHCWTHRYGITIGVDTALFGDDDTAIHVRSGPLSVHHESHNGWGQDKTASKVKELCEIWAHHYNSWAVVPTAPKMTPDQVRVQIELDGPGWGVMSHCNGFGDWMGVGVSESADEYDSTGRPIYVNKRSAMWFHGRKKAMLSEMDLSKLPQDVLKKLKLQLLAPSYKQEGNGALSVEKKDKVKERLSRSPDDADSLLICYYEVNRDLPQVVTAKGSDMGHNNWNGEFAYLSGFTGHHPNGNGRR